MVTEGEPDNDPVSVSPGRKRRFAWLSLSLSLSAFIMSFTTSMINVYYALRSAEIVVQPPRHVLFYRDGEGERSVLSAAVRLELINTAKDYGDVLIDSRLIPFPGEPAFVQEGVAQPAFTPNATEVAKDCALGSSCIGLDGLVVIQRSDVIMDIPGGSAKELTPYFWILPYGCEGDKAKCAAYANFDHAVARLATRSLDLRIRLRFQDDGEREVICRGGKLDAEYLRVVGWTQLACEESVVTKPGFF